MRSTARSLLLCVFTVVSPGPLLAASPLSPQEALAAFQLEPGLKIELVAAEPLVIDPVAMAFDERGRMYVVEMRDYPALSGPPLGRVALLEDKDGDGYFETRHEFADKLVSPNGVTCWDGGVFVTSAPDVIYFKDTDDDGVADIRRKVFTGFDLGGSSQLRVNHPTFGIDNWIYLANGLSDGTVKSLEYPAHKSVVLQHNDFRFRPDTDQFEAIGGFAQYGLSFDDFGHRFICMNREHINQVVLEPRYLQRNPNLPFSQTYTDISDHGAACKLYPLSHNVTTAAWHAGTFTAACSVSVYRGTALPEEYRGNSFTCEPTGNLVHRDVLKLGGAALIATRGRDNTEFLRTADDWCRPVFLANAPDGALYICDMYRKTIEHPVYLPEEIRKITDFESGKNMGRIWRVTAIDAKPFRKPFDLSHESGETLANRLASPDGWWRDTAQRLLIERKDKSIADFVRVVLTDKTPPAAHAQALWTLAGLDALDDSDILRALDDSSPAVRGSAVRLAESRLTHSHSLDDQLKTLSNDPDPGVRFQVALSLGVLGETIIPQLVAIAGRDMEDRFTRAAVLSSCAGFNGKLMDAFVQDQHMETKGSNAERLAITLKIMGAETPEALLQMTRLVSTTTGAAESMQTCATILTHVALSQLPVSCKYAVIRGLLDGLARGKKKTDLKTLVSAADRQSPGIAKYLDELISAAKEVALNSAAADGVRLEAISILTHADQETIALEELISPQEPTQIQLAAVNALLQRASAKTMAALVEPEKWSELSPSVRAAMASGMMRTYQGTLALLDAVDAGTIKPTALAPAQREGLMKSQVEVVRKRATALFAQLGGSDRKKAYQDSLAALKLPADPQHGWPVFTRLCAQCHQLQGQGVPVGPDLTGVRNQSPETLLMHIVIPEAEILPGYQSYIVETTDGQTLTGILISQTPTSVTLRRNLGQEETVLRSNITSMYVDSLSLMPQELEKNMTAQELADVIALLRGSGPGWAPGSAPRESGKVAE